LGFLGSSVPMDPILARLNFSRLLRYSTALKCFVLLKSIESKIRKRDFLFVVENPYPYIERYPNCYEHIRSSVMNNAVIPHSQKVSVQLHLVRAKTSINKMSERYTSDDWYCGILDEIVTKLESSGSDYEILIHTDVSSRTSWSIPRGANEATLKFWRNSGIVDSEGKLQLQDDGVLSRYKNYPKLKVLTDIDPVSAWEIMSRADYLIIGKSSFSFVGALLNTNGVIISPNFWHKGPKHWVSIDDTKDNLDFKL